MAQFKKPKTRSEIRYGDPMIGKLINKVMLDGKKETASGIVYTALERLAKEKGKTPTEIIAEVIERAAPLIEVKSRRVGGANYQVPVEVKPKRRTLLVYRWVLNAVRAKSGKPSSERLYDELKNILEGTGGVMKQREDLHKMAESNRAFAHFSRY